MKLVTVALLSSTVALGCGGAVQQATIVAPSAQNASAAVEATGQHWALIPQRSRVDVVGVDVVGGKHPVSFDRWRGHVTIGPPNRLVVEVEMDSAKGESEWITHILKYELLEADRFPTATFQGTIDERGLVEVNAKIHGIERGLRFHGALTREGNEYHFVAKFKISRDAFAIHSQASWDGLIKDDVHIYLDVRAREERVTVEEKAER